MHRIAIAASPASSKRKAALIGGIAALALLFGIGVLASTAGAARKVTPSSSAPPTVRGTAQAGQRLNGDRGTWLNSPTDYNYFWTRCDRDGGSCADIGGANSTNYTLGSADVGNSVRFKVQASNSSGASFASSVPTAVVVAASQPVPVPPQATTLPSLSGSGQVGQKLTGDRGKWSGNPVDYNYLWTRCDSTGASCADIGGATAATYTLVGPDAGNAVRFKVQARNADGSTFASSAALAVAGGSSSTGCPSGNGNGSVAIGSVTAPARLIIDQQQSNPTVITRSTQVLTLRYHVSACGKSVQGAMLYTAVVPFNVLTIPAETATDASGWAVLNLNMLTGFPVSNSQQLVAIFVRASKTGDPALGGISTRRLFSVPVNLKR